MHRSIELLHACHLRRSPSWSALENMCRVSQRPSKSAPSLARPCPLSPRLQDLQTDSCFSASVATAAPQSRLLQAYARRRDFPSADLVPVLRL